jgi:paraquat-inducible protein B
MSKRASPTLIGGFVAGAIALAIAGVAVFGSGRLFRDTDRYVLYFDSDVNGLKVGAPVKFKGVEIGSVSDIQLNITSMGVTSTDNANPAYIPVVVELDWGRIRHKSGNTQLEGPKVLRLAIQAGLRGRLALESLVTGVLYVQLDMYPGSKVRLSGEEVLPYPEIPTVPTPLEQAQMRASKFLMKLEDVDIAGLIDSLGRTASGLDHLVNSPNLTHAIDSIDATIAAFDQTIESTQQLVEEIRASIPPLEATIAKAANSADTSLQQAQTTLMRIDGLVDADSPLLYQLQMSMEEVANAARAVRVLTDSLERNPSSLVRGKPAPEETR